MHSGTAQILSTHPTPPGANQTDLSPTKFLGEFGGGDVTHLTLPLGPNASTVRLQFDAYLLRTWDGSDKKFFGGPDIFGFGYNNVTLLDASFSNGIGEQTYCPFAPSNPCPATWGSDPNQKNRLGFNVELEPVPGSGPAKGTPMSLVYHFDTGPIPYTGSTITFSFFSSGLQLHPELADQVINGSPGDVIDESWGLDNFGVVATFVPEPHIWFATLAGLLLIGSAARFRQRQR